MLAVVAYNRQETPVSSYRIVFLDTLNQFIGKKDIDSLLAQEYTIKEATLGQLDMGELEDRIESIPAVKNAEIYSKLDGHLMLEIHTEKPLISVINQQQEHYYIAQSGSLIPPGNNYVPRLPVANGHISLAYADSVNLKNPGAHFTTAAGLYKIAKYIDQHKFWQAQIEQLYVTEKGEYEMLPRVGAHVILLGDTTQMQWKFRKLYALYKQGFKRKNWNDYEEINLKFGNQVVCSKR